MKRWIHASSDSTRTKIEDFVRSYVQRHTEEGLEDNTAFFKGDNFAWCQDEVAFVGQISKCVDKLVSAVSDDPELMNDEDDMLDILYDDEVIEMLYNMSDIVRVFRKAGVELPDWYFE